MLLEKEREDVVEYGKQLITKGLTSGTGGNISICDREKKLFAISPSGMAYFDTTPEDVVVVDFEGRVVAGERKPSSEIEMHRQIYVHYAEADAIVHCHSTFATVLSTLRQDLPASNYVVADAGGNSVRCADYACFGTPEIAENAVKALKGRRACLQANHGQICFGRGIEEAFKLAISIEWACKIHVLACCCGTPKILSDTEMAEVMTHFASYGQKKE